MDFLKRDYLRFKQAEPDSEEEIMEAILYVYENWKNEELKVVPNCEYISQFQGKYLTESFVNILDTIQ